MTPGAAHLPVSNGTRLGLVVALVLAALPRTATANGRFPATISLSAREDAPDTLMLGATYGLVLSVNQGANWFWVCEQAIGYMGTFDPIFLHANSGAFFASTFDGVVRSTDGGCEWMPVTGLDGEGILSLVEDPGTPGRFYAGGGGGTMMGFDAVYVSNDDGVTFTPTALTHPSRFFQGVAVAPTNPMVVYAAGWHFNPRESFIHRSDDGGATWMDYEHPLASPDWIELLGVSSTDENIVLWLHNGNSDSIMRSVDGGMTATQVLDFADPSNPFAGFTITADGTMYALALGSGLFRSFDDGATWESVAGTPPLSCISAVGMRLYGCASPFATPTGWALGYSDDGGKTFTGIYNLPDVDDVLGCPVGSATTELCTPLLPQLRATLDITGIDDAGTTDSGTGSDAGVSTDSGTDNGGGDCKCRLSRAGPGPNLPATLLTAGLLALLVVGRRRRR